MAHQGDNSDDDYDDEEDDDYYSYNDADPDLELYKQATPASEAEYFKYKEMKPEDVECLINEDVESLCKLIDLPPSISRILLSTFGWNVKDVEQRIRADFFKLLSDVHILPPNGNVISPSDSRAVQLAVQTAQKISSNTSTTRPLLRLKPASSQDACEVCYSSPEPLVRAPPTGLSMGEINLVSGQLYGMSCGHRFCLECWQEYLRVQSEGQAINDVQCMAQGCPVRVMDDFLFAVLKGSPLKERYIHFSSLKMIETHPKLRFCVGNGCPVIICALESPKSRCVKCLNCSSEFCFNCGDDYHAPTDCDTIKKWLIKCRDDSGTAYYMSVNTKDCPQCHVCIEKSGGCNHMMCSKCQFEFCWICLGPWKTHHAQYYFCSKYNESNEDQLNNVRGRESLKRYLFYYHRWLNHGRSLRLEQEQRARIQARIEEKVLNKQGTWIDWQYLLKAADTLLSCRYTLKYTYPYAYYWNNLSRKDLFEYQQALLEAEVEDLSWKIEHAEITDRAELQNKIDVCEKHRLTLLDEFLAN